MFGSFMIPGSLDYRKRAVYRLGKYDPHKLMRKGQLGDRKTNVRRLLYLRREPVRASYNKANITAHHTSPVDNVSKLLGRELLSLNTQGDLIRPRRNCGEYPLSFGRKRRAYLALRGRVGKLYLLQLNYPRAAKTRKSLDIFGNGIAKIVLLQASDRYKSYVYHMLFCAPRTAAQASLLKKSKKSTKGERPDSRSPFLFAYSFARRDGTVHRRKAFLAF